VAAPQTQEFATLLRRHRLLAGLSQEALAERAQVSVRGISDLERGVRRSPHPGTIARLAAALDLDATARQTMLLAATQGPVPPAVATADAALREALAAPQTAEPLAAPPHVAEPPAEERRWVTVLAVRLGGFAKLAERLDLEDLHVLSDRCAERIASEIRRFDGTVLRTTGDSILAVFGAPIAHEDDAERAARAGLAIRDCPLPDSNQLQLHIGIDTGEVLAGPRGIDGQRHYAISGAPVSVAIGLTVGATATGVLVGEQTYRATYQHVRYRPRAPLEARDWSRPLSAWEALEIAPAPHPRALGHAEFVGRDHELDVLRGALGRVLREQRPHLVSVLGEPGIGKSRLIFEFERRVLASTSITVLRGRCQPYGEVVGYRALASALRNLAGVTTDDAAAAARSKLHDLVDQTLQADSPGEIERHLALLIGLDTDADRTGNPTDERSMHVSVRRFFEALALTRPVCLMIEDLHWADEALLNLLEHVAERAVTAPLLIVTQARPDLLDKRPTWGGGIQSFTSLPLQPIDRGAGQALASALCRDRGLSTDDAQHISRLSGGNPLFAEELCGAMADGHEAGGVPTALRALISSRLDTLPASEKRALQHAAVLGNHI